MLISTTNTLKKGCNFILKDNTSLMSIAFLESICTSKQRARLGLNGKIGSTIKKGVAY